MISNMERNDVDRQVFDFLNRVFDSMKMHKAKKQVYITEKTHHEETG